MEDQNYAQIFKIKALDRWENEGGRFCSDQSPTSGRRTTDKRGRIDNAAQHSNFAQRIDQTETNTGGRI